MARKALIQRAGDSRPTFLYPSNQPIMENPTTPSDTIGERSHDEWATTIRDPAEAADEGERIVATRNRRATARYNIAPLPDGHFAITTGCEFVGFAGSYSIWEAFETREACIAHILSSARRFFGREIEDSGHRSARDEMLELLSADSLFGFVEPELS